VNGLEGVRVLVLDDKADEALPVIKAFSRKGVPVAYFDGRPRGLPSKARRLRGVRLAVLDIDLGEGGTGNNIPSAMVQRLGRILHPDNGPYAVVLWTNHADQRDKVKEYIFQHQELPNPLFTEMITKAECKSRGVFSLDAVTKRVQNALKDIGPLQLMQHWEGGCLEAAATVTNALGSVTEHAGAELDGWCASWKADMNALLRTIASARAEARLDSSNCVASICATLSPLHADAMDSQSPSLCATAAAEAGSIIGAARQLSIDGKATINTMLHLDMRSTSEPAPGSIYAYRWNRPPGWFPKFTEIVEGALQKTNDQEQQQRIEQLRSEGRAACIEISAACDYAQKKVQAARFLPGMIIPASRLKYLNSKAQFLKIIGPVSMGTKLIPRGVYHFVFTSRFVISLEIGRATALRPCGRLRSQALADMQSWFGYQVARQGMTLLK
jgi:hypothetical protein